MSQASEFDYFENGILSIMTQREPHEDNVSIEKFWSQQELQSQSALVSDHESDPKIEMSTGTPIKIGLDVDIDAWDWDHCDFESEDYQDDEFFNIHDVYTHNSDTSAFLEQCRGLSFGRTKLR